MHTPASDGLITPKDLIDSDNSFVAITDHNSLNFIFPYMCALRNKVQIIPGVEITTNHNKKNSTF